MMDRVHGEGSDLAELLKEVAIQRRRINALSFLIKLTVLGIESTFTEESDEEKSDIMDSVLGAFSVLFSRDELAMAMDEIGAQLGT